MLIVIILFMIGGLTYTTFCRNLNKGVENLKVSMFKTDTNDFLNELIFDECCLKSCN